MASEEEDKPSELLRGLIIGTFIAVVLMTIVALYTGNANREKGQDEIRREAVDRGYGRWVVSQVDKSVSFEWIKKP